jgi:hypothetical protein
VQLSSSSLYQSSNFALQLEFCKLARRLLVGPCADERRSLVERQRPGNLGCSKDYLSVIAIETPNIVDAVRAKLDLV